MPESDFIRPSRSQFSTRLGIAVVSPLGYRVDTNCDEVAGSAVLSLDGIADTFRNRTERIAFARNCYLLELRRRLSLGA